MYTLASAACFEGYHTETVVGSRAERQRVTLEVEEERPPLACMKASSAKCKVQSREAKEDGHKRAASTEYMYILVHRPMRLRTLPHFFYALMHSCLRLLTPQFMATMTQNKTSWAVSRGRRTQPGASLPPHLFSFALELHALQVKSAPRLFVVRTILTQAMIDLTGR